MDTGTPFSPNFLNKTKQIITLNRNIIQINNDFTIIQTNFLMSTFSSLNCQRGVMVLRVVLKTITIARSMNDDSTPTQALFLRLWIRRFTIIIIRAR